MSALGFILLAVIVFMLGWRLIGVTDPRITSIITGAAALFMAAAVVFQGATVFSSKATAPIGALLLLWAIYGALVAGFGATEFGLTAPGGRALALYALLLSVAMVAFAFWFGAHGLAAGVIVTLVVAVPFFLQFIEEIVPVRAMRGLVGFLMLIAGVISLAAGWGVYMGLIA